MKRTIYLIGGLLIAASLASSHLFYKQMSGEKDKVVALRAEIDKVSSEEIELRKDISEIKDEKESLNAQIQSQSAKVQGLHEEISLIQKEEDGLSTELSQSERAFAGLKGVLDEITQKHSELDGELKRSKSDYMATVERIDLLRKQKQDLEKKIGAYITPPKGVELKKIVVKVSPPLEGEIIEVNKEYSFAIVDLGIKDDLKSGNILAIYRNEEFIAKAVVENVYEDMSSIIVLDEWADAVIAPGDITRLLKP